MEHQQIQILLRKEVLQHFQRFLQQVVVVEHLQVVQVEDLAVQVEELVKINLTLEVMVINHPYLLHKVIQVVMEILVQDLLVQVVEQVLSVVT